MVAHVPFVVLRRVSDIDLMVTPYHFVFLLLGWSFAALILYGIFRRALKTSNPAACLDYVITIVVFCLYVSNTLSWLVIYFGIPGLHVGRILPSSCDASILIEGPGGWPCYLKRLREWTIQFLGSSSRGEAVDLGRPWIAACFWGFFVIASLVVPVFWCRRLRLRDQREQYLESEKTREIC